MLAKVKPWTEQIVRTKCHPMPLKSNEDLPFTDTGESVKIAVNTAHASKGGLAVIIVLLLCKQFRVQLRMWDGEASASSEFSFDREYCCYWWSCGKWSKIVDFTAHPGFEYILWDIMAYFASAFEGMGVKDMWFQQGGVTHHTIRPDLTLFQQMFLGGVNLQWILAAGESMNVLWPIHGRYQDRKNMKMLFMKWARVAQSHCMMCSLYLNWLGPME